MAARTCTQCNAVTINGVYCHEHGCPDAWKDATYICDCCGEEFLPQHKNDNLCEGCREDELDWLASTPPWEEDDV